jgi:hypothetical protein
MNRRKLAVEIEMRLLVLAARPSAVPADIAEIHAILQQPLDWTLLVKSAMRHGLTAQAFARLLHVAEPELPADIAEAARTNITQLRARNRTLIAELVTVLDALDAAQIDAIPIKGPVLAHLVYGDATIRACRDLDILLRHADAGRALARLGELGFRPYPEAPPLTARQNAALDALAGQAALVNPDAPAAVEPHWALVPGNLRHAIDHDGLWRRSRPIVFAEREILGLAPEDLVLVLAIHGGKDEWSRLQSVADLARAIVNLAGLDWALVLARAKEQRCQRMLLTGMRLAERLMGVILPPAIAAACAADRAGDALADAAAAQMLQHGPTRNSIFAISRYRFRLHDRRWDGIRYVTATALTPREQHFGLVRLPDRLFFFYSPIKVVHDYILLPIWLLVKAFRTTGAAER